jgi:hypothetical protein
MKATRQHWNKGHSSKFRICKCTKEHNDITEAKIAHLVLQVFKVNDPLRCKSLDCREAIGHGLNLVGDGS